MLRADVGQGGERAAQHQPGDGSLEGEAGGDGRAEALAEQHQPCGGHAALGKEVAVGGAGIGGQSSVGEPGLPP